MREYRQLVAGVALADCAGRSLVPQTPARRVLQSARAAMAWFASGRLGDNCQGNQN
jgi:hypothetical protein